MAKITYWGLKVTENNLFRNNENCESIPRNYIYMHDKESLNLVENSPRLSLELNNMAAWNEDYCPVPRVRYRTPLIMEYKLSLSF